MHPYRFLPAGALALGALLPLTLLDAAPAPARGAREAAPGPVEPGLAMFALDEPHAYALFRIQHLGTGWNYGRFNRMSAELRYDPEDPAAGSLSIEVRTDSVDTGNGKRDKHLRSPDFFNVRQFPVMRFQSRKVEQVGPGRLQVSGELTLHGVTRPLTVEVEITGQGEDPWGNYRVGFETRFTLNRLDFGMDFMADKLGHEVEVTVAFEAIRQ